MELNRVAVDLNLSVFYGHDEMDTLLSEGYVEDLLSNDMTNNKERDFWISRHVDQNVTVVARLKGLVGIPLVQGDDPPEDSPGKVFKESIPIIDIHLCDFEIVGRVYDMAKGEVDSIQF